jgi:hypothetical protein
MTSSVVAANVPFQVVAKVSATTDMGRKPAVHGPPEGVRFVLETAVMCCWTNGLESRIPRMTVENIHQSGNSGGSRPVRFRLGSGRHQKVA